MTTLDQAAAKPAYGLLGGRLGPNEYPGFDIRSSPLNWTNIIFVTFLHLGAGVAVWSLVSHFGDPGTILGISTSVFWVALGLGFITSMGVTVGYHRYATHGGFDAVRPLEAFMLLTGGMTIQGPLTRWRYHHEVHHAYTDKVNWDPHTPTQFANPVLGFAWSHMLWFFKRLDLVKLNLRPESPLERIQRRYYWAVILFSYALPWAASGFRLEGLLVGGFLRIMVTLHVTACINSVAHVWGDQLDAFREKRRNEGKTARNVFGWLGLWILSMGESWHNNHHYLPSCVLHGWSVFQIDVTGWIIKGLAKLHLIRNVKWMTEERQRALAKEKRVRLSTMFPLK